MIIIYPERLDTATGITADSEDGEFPAENLEDNRPGRLWKADATNVAKITIPAEAGTDCAAVFNTNAQSAACVLKDMVGGSTLDTENFDLAPSSGRVFDRFFWNYTAQSSACVVEITLTAEVGQTVYAGAARIGAGAVFENPQYGIRQARESLATVLEMSNRSRYVSQDPGSVETRRVFDLTVLDDRDDVFSLDTVLDYFGPNPMAVLVAEGFDNMEWAVFGFVDADSLYSASHDHYSHSSVGFTLTEAV